jgi:hypothetical protein
MKISKLLIAAGVATLAALAPISLTASADGGGLELAVSECSAQSCLYSSNQSCPATGAAKRYIAE